MSRPIEPSPVLGLCSCLTGQTDLLPAVESELSGTFGGIALKSSAFPFDTSSYYQEEMGEELQRHWYCLPILWRAELLPRYRAITNGMEKVFLVAGKRRVNLDPGYLDLGKLVMASLKAAPDKIYLGAGVWAHTCLRYDSGAFRAPEHSFADFKDGRFDAFMLEARALYKNLLQQSSPPGL